MQHQQQQRQQLCPCCDEPLASAVLGSSGSGSAKDAEDKVEEDHLSPFVTLPCLHLLCVRCLNDAGDAVAYCTARVDADGVPCNAPFRHTDVLQQHEPVEGAANEDAAIDPEELDHRVVALRDHRLPLVDAALEKCDKLLETLALHAVDVAARGTTPERREICSGVLKDIAASTKAVEQEQDVLRVARAHMQLALDAVGSEATSAQTRLFAFKRLKMLASESLAAPWLAPLARSTADVTFAKDGSHTIGRKWVTSRDYTAVNKPISELKLAFRGLIGVAALPDGTLLAADCDTPVSGSCLMLLSRSGERMGRIGEGVQPFGVAVSGNGTIWVACRAMNQLRSYQPDGTLLSTIDVIGGYPHSLDVLRDGSIVASVSAESDIVVLYGPDGKERWSSTGRGFRNARGVVVVDGEVFVCDNHNHRLQVLSLADGSFVRMIETGASTHRYPSSITWDPAARVLVLGTLYHVSVWTRDGAHIHTLDHSVSGCFGCCLAPDGSLVIANSNHSCILVF